MRACFCSLLGHAAGLVVLGMSFAAVQRSPSDGLALTAGSIEATTDDFAELDLQAIEIEESAPASFSELLVETNVLALPIVEFGQRVQPAVKTTAAQSEVPLESLSVDLAAGSENAERRLRKSANFYGIEAHGNDFVFVVDMSGSMTGARFRRARAELRRSIESLAAPQRFYVLFFNDRAWPMPASDLQEATEENLNDARRWLKQAQCQGGTNPLPALMLALDLRPDAIFLLSDGRFDPEAARQLEQSETSPPIPVHTIGFASREGEPMLRAISEASGGAYRFVR